MTDEIKRLKEKLKSKDLSHEAMQSIKERIKILESNATVKK